MTDDTKDGHAPDVRNAPELHRFEVRVDGELAGFTEYLDDENQRIFFHTEIGEQFGGRGLATTLIRLPSPTVSVSALRIRVVARPRPPNCSPISVWKKIR